MSTRILLAFAILSSLSIAFVGPVARSPDAAAPPVSVAVWSPETGRRATILAEQRPSTYLYLTGQTLTTYEALIPSAVLASLVSSEPKWDSSWAVKVTIWMYWTGLDYGGITWVSVSRYETMWQLYDSSVRMTNARMNAGCAGEAWPGDQPCIPPKHQSRWIGSPTSGTRYSLTPSWAGNRIAIYDLNYQAGNSRVELRRGTTTRWYLDICIYKGNCAQMGW